MPTSFSSKVPSHTFYFVKGTQILELNQAEAPGPLISNCEMSYFFSMNTTSCSQLGIYVPGSVVKSSYVYCKLNINTVVYYHLLCEFVGSFSLEDVVASPIHCFKLLFVFLTLKQCIIGLITPTRFRKHRITYLSVCTYKWCDVSAIVTESA